MRETKLRRRGTGQNANRKASGHDTTTLHDHGSSRKLGLSDCGGSRDPRTGWTRAGQDGVEHGSIALPSNELKPADGESYFAAAKFDSSVITSRP